MHNKQNKGYVEKEYDNDIIIYIEDTFKALADAIVPWTPTLGKIFGVIQSYGAQALYTDEYTIYSLNYFEIPLALPTAQMLDVAASELMNLSQNKQYQNDRIYPMEGSFAFLLPKDRFRAITLLEDLNINLTQLPMPYKNNPGLVLSMTSALNRFVTMGYYSEWWAYGTTRLDSPNKRQLEAFPISWEQVDYPGPSYGYKVFRGYLINEFTD
ncbi:hypothetical protein EDC19_2668 [Natranaerovirga hydrolytica]|uniref:Uncharacterized protein n=1 Tax=Natranaerovirga hydrolytica TaxID=680378 RepID=A0A4V2PZ07_9FIRM|nr:hypothetical protein [Natranaerovirga hydrolytica]TCK88021.1 hypothetical protein EDC19_2668 [Natranaerovirga hydrolytica]